GPIAAAGNLTFTLRANPSDTMLGARNATVAITTDLPMAANCATSNATYTSTGPAVSLSPGMTIDFGAVDVGGPTATTTLTISNTGDGTMSITSIGALTTPFTKTAPGSMTIGAGGMQTIDISYHPTTEHSAANPEIDTFVVTTTGLYAG